MTFSKELKEATKVSHSAAENTKFVAGFLRGVVDQKTIANSLLTSGMFTAPWRD